LDKTVDRNKEFNLRIFGNDILIYTFGQAALLLFGLIQSLIIPKYLSTVDYGYWQFFLLFNTYVGLLHLGFLSGLLIRWAGKDLKDISEEIPTAFNITIIGLVLEVTLLLPFAAFINLLPKEITFAVLANAILLNLLAFFVVISQSVKQFKIITRTNILNGFLFLLALLIIFSYGVQGYFSLIFATLIVNIIIILLFIFHFRHHLFHKCSCITSLHQYVKENIGIGIFILFSNFISLLFVTIDRLTVGAFFPITDFAVYAFALNMCCFITVFLQAISQVFFPYLSGFTEERKLKAFQLLKPFLIILWAGALAVYFPLSALIRNYLPNYVGSLPLMAILLCTIGFGGQIQILHANFFKVYRRQREYFILAGISLVGAVALNLLVVKIFGTLTTVAATAVISFCIWYLLNECSLRHFMSVDIREIAKWLLVICLYAIAFLGTSILAQNWMHGMFIYIPIFVLITGIAFKSELINIINLFKSSENRE
jgi:O-antigen/teichoic acid export membrane protein